MKRYKSVDAYIADQGSWTPPLERIRQLLLDSELEETVKWGMPVYTLKNKNVAGIGAFKSYVGIWFYQGVFLKDPHNLLVNAQEGKTKALRQMRFHAPEEIDSDIIREYIKEAIQNQKDGKEVKVNRKTKIVIPEELQQAFDDQNGLKSDFENLTSGKQREFAKYISEAKRAETRQNRLEKVIPMIQQGIGLNDKYK